MRAESIMKAPFRIWAWVNKIALNAVVGIVILSHELIGYGLCDLWSC